MAKRQVTYATADDEILIRIVPRKGLVGWAFLLLAPVWIVAVGAVLWAGDPVVDVHAHTIDAGFFMAVAFILMMIYAAWLLFGEEVITAEQSALAVHHRPLGVGRKWIFDAGEISGIENREPGYCIVPARKCGGFILTPYSRCIAFWYMGRQYRFGSGLTDEQARQLINKLRHYLPKSAFSL